jgi:hypothetical protein
MSRDPVVVVPADLDVEDRIAGPVTFRMAAWLAAAAGGVALVATARGAVHLTVLGVVVIAVGLTGAWWRPGGRPVAAWIGPLLAYRKRRRGAVTVAPVEDATLPEPEPVAVESPAVAEPRPGRSVRLPQRFAVGAVAVAVLAASASVVASRDGRGLTPAAPVADVVSPDPAPPNPVVVVVPIDPFTGWEVGGDVVDPLCGC